ncbi:MAG: TIGR03936 family radical SAM-associated protein [Eubacteriaceae bacterium]|nr:TIGR03936 family radical SAM-associated protein [Eubacteriaceae bacterium]
MKYRLCYEKKDSLIFISQLDLQGVFQRAFRRAKVQLEYTQGFHPHPKMTYSPPLALYVASKEEYLDVALEGEQDEKEIFAKISAVLPRDLILRSVEALDENSPSLPSFLIWADYEIVLRGEALSEDVAKEIEGYVLNSSEILIQKKNKKKQIVTKDLRPLIESFAAKVVDGEIVINASLSLLNDTLLSPVLLTNTIKERVPSANHLITKSIVKVGTHK